MESCHRVRSLDTSDIKYTAASVMGKCLSVSGDHDIFYLFRNWDRACPELEDEIYSLSNNTLATGYMDIQTAPTGFDKAYRIPGAQMNYKCSSGFGLPTGDNPEQILKCPGSRKIDRTQVTLCERKNYLKRCLTITPFPQLTSATLEGRIGAVELAPRSAGRARSSSRPR